MPMVLQSAPVLMRVSTVADDTDIPTKLYSQLLTCCMNSNQIVQPAVDVLHEFGPPADMLRPLLCNYLCGLPV